jgi:hypothetical protein
MKCAIKYCRGRVTERDRSNICAKHRSRQFKERYPLKYAYAHLRSRARERDKSFELSFEQYEAFAKETGYDLLRGKHSWSLSIHRKDNARGYSIDNIEAVTLGHNSRLQFSPMPEYLKAEMAKDLHLRTA